nr:transposase [Streptomyces roseifaciens]
METFTGLRSVQFDRLLRVVWGRGGDGLRGGRPWALPLAERVPPVAVYYRPNLTMRQVAVPFGVSTAGVCRVIHRLGLLLALEPARRPQGADERLWIVDGTLIPVRDRSVAASSRNYRFSANMQVIVDAGTRLVVATARPVPGTTAYAPRMAASGLAVQCEGATVLGDGAYISTGLFVPHRKRPRRPLLKGEEEDNAEHRRVRARGEHAFARMKNCKILRDCRHRGDGLHHAVQAVAHGELVSVRPPCGKGSVIVLHEVAQRYVFVFRKVEALGRVARSDELTLYG